MEAFHYVDIFATKGVEYLVVISFLFFLVLAWVVFNKPAPKTAPAGIRRFGEKHGWFVFLSDRFYHVGHAWAKPIGPKKVRIGMDDFAQKLLGTPDAIKLPQPGDTLYQGDRGWQVSVDSKTIDMLSPVGGKVVAVNPKVLKEPAIIKENPYKDGWLIEVEAPKAKADLKNLLGGSLAKAWIAETVATLQNKMSGELGYAMQDGGIMVDGFAKSLSPENWQELAASFLKTDDLDATD